MGLGLSLLLASLLLGLGHPQDQWWAQWVGISLEDHPTIRSQPRQQNTADTKPALQEQSQISEKSAIPISQWLINSNLPAGHPEKRLIEIYAHIEQGEFTAALRQAQALVKDHPNFQLAHLIHGDLLRLRYQPDSLPANASASGQMAALRSESHMRLDALRNRPAPGAVPKQLLAVSAQSRHVIAIDASRGRLYWFENQTVNGTENLPSLKLISDFFISVGKSGIRKQLEGDGRTPLGIYHVTSIKDRKGLPEFYGAGALPLNYPNAIDVHKGRTGSGIWLHGTPPNQFVRAPLASDGCVVLANPDMQRLLDQVPALSTPVIIADRLEWVHQSDLTRRRKSIQDLLVNWQTDRSVLSSHELNTKYAVRPTGLQKIKDSSLDWTVNESARLGIAQISLLETEEPEPGLVATFEETASGISTGVVRRQYWLQQDAQWRLVQDTVMAGTPSSALKRSFVKPVLTAEAQAAPSKSNPAANDEPRNSHRTKPRVTIPDTSVQQALQAWTKAWSHKNMQAYFKAYDTTFTPPGGVSRKAWEQDRTDRILGKSTIALSLINLKIQVEGDRATVTFVQRYKADKLEVTGHKTLRLIKRGDDWRITQENVG